MALDDPYAVPPTGSIYGLDDAPVWPPPHWPGAAPGDTLQTLPEYPTTTAQNPTLPPPPPPPPPQQIGGPVTSPHDELAQPTLPPPDAAAAPAPQAASPPNLGDLGIEPEYVGQPPMPAPVDAAYPGGAGPEIPAPVDPYAADAAAAAPPPAPETDPQLAMFGVPTTQPTDEERHQQYLDAIGGKATEQANMTPEQLDVDVAKRHAGESAEDYVTRVQQFEATKRHDLSTQLLEASRKREEAAQRDYNDFMTAQKNAAADRAQVEADAKKIATYDPDHWAKGLGVGDTIAASLSIVLGGLGSGYTGGRNVGLEIIQKKIDADNEAQRFNIGQARAEIGRRSSAISEGLQQTAEQYRAKQLYANTVYEAYVNDLQTKAQDYDPHGSTRLAIEGQIRAVRAAQLASNEKYQATQQKTEIDLKKANAEILEKQANARHLDAESQKILNKLGGTGAGGPTNPNFTVPTTFFDPFTNEPIFGKEAIGGKGKEKFEDATRAQIGTYGHVQDYWAKLRTIGAKVGYHKSLGESVWSKFKDTDSAEYDAAKHALVVYLTKELGDKLTQGQIDEQSQRIPERASIIESRDPEKQIADAQEDADRDFTRDMNLVGINSAPIVANAQKMRAPAPTPNGDEAIAAAQSAAATADTSSKRKDAAAALAAAKAQKQAELEQESHGEEEVKSASSATARTIINPPKDLPPAIATELSARNNAALHHNQHLDQFRELPAVPDTKGKSKGEQEKATADHDKLLRQHALKVAQDRKAFNTAEKSLDEKLFSAITARDGGGLPPAVIEKIARRYTTTDPSKFGDDMKGQAEHGYFLGQLNRLDPFKRQKLIHELRKELLE